MIAMRRLTGMLLVAVGLLATAPTTAGAAVNMFTNTTPIVGPPNGTAINKADPSPSTINVAGIPGVVTDVNVFLDGVNASNISDDLDVLLQGPFGQTTMLLSDAGGANAASNLNIQLTDQAGSLAPDSTALAGQAYKPTDYGTNLMDAPGLDPMINVEAPPPPYGLTLSLFNGTSPNGAWNLYVDDDANAAATIGIANGWRIQISTTDPPPTPTPTTTTPVTTTAATPAKKKCKKGRKLKRGKCVKKKKK